MKSERPNVRIALASRPENVALVREALTGVAETVQLGEAIEDIKAAVSEAANNVVMHAYPGGEGPMEVELALAPHEVRVVVRDHGVGIGPRLISMLTPRHCIAGQSTIRTAGASAPGGGVGAMLSWLVPASARGCPCAGEDKDSSRARDGFGGRRCAGQTSGHTVIRAKAHQWKIMASGAKRCSARPAST